jgi:hypothetical protein
VTDPRTDRIAALAETMTALEPPAVRLARVRLTCARRDLATLLRHGSPSRLVHAARYRVDRAQTQLEEAWRDALHGAPATA